MRHARFRHPLRPLLAAAGALLLMAPSTGSMAAEELEEHLTRDWYQVEVVVFQRPAVQEHTVEERLASPPAPLPRSLRSFRMPPDERRAAYRLTPFTRAFLTFPYLDHSQLPQPRLTQPEEFDPLQAQQSGTAADPVREDDLRGPPAEASDQQDASGAEPPAIEPRLAPDPLLDFLRRLADYEASLEADSFRWLKPDTFTLTSEARRLTRRGGFQVLLHGRWLQPVPPREAPEPLLIQAGPRYGDVFALEGTLAVTLGRYLHFRADLLYTEPLLGQAPIDRALPPASARTGSLLEGESPKLSQSHLETQGFMQLHHSRRLRSEELHYLDHPKLGVLVRIDPVEPPESLSAAHVALEEGDE